MRRRAHPFFVVFCGLFAAPAWAADVSTDVSPWFGNADEVQAPWVVGHLDFGLGARFPDSFTGDNDPFGLANGFGRANLALFGGPLNFEAEVGGWVVFQDGDTFHTLQGIGHLWLSLPAAAAGAFGGVTDYFGTEIPTAGLEGQIYLGNLTLGAQGSYNWDDTAADSDVWGVRGDAAFYLNPDFRLGGDVQYWNVGGADIWQGGVDVEKRLTGTPIGAGASLVYFEGEDFSAWTGMVHLRIFVDPAGWTLQQHDRTVPFAFSLPLFGG